MAVRTEPWNCPTCSVRRLTRFCSRCGEERLRPHDLTIRDLAAQTVRQVTSIDGKLLRSLRAVLLKPGVRTAGHVRGQRRQYIGPLALFFVANALFFAIQSLTGTNVLGTPLEGHLTGQDWSGLARSLVADRLAEQGRTLAGYSPVFDEAAIFNAKALMILMVIGFAPILIAVFGTRRMPLGGHVIFALHLYVFVLVLLCAALLIAQVELELGGDGLRSPTIDLLLSLFNVAAVCAYLYLAIGEAYDARGWARAGKAALLAAAVALLFVGYRFVIFLITLYTT